MTHLEIPKEDLDLQVTCKGEIEQYCLEKNISNIKNELDWTFLENERRPLFCGYSEKREPCEEK